MDGDVGETDSCPQDALRDSSVTEHDQEDKKEELDRSAVVPSSDALEIQSTSSLTVKLNKLNCESTSDDPKPGPSNSAADFDLEVFDSGSSCSNEECWEVNHDHTGKNYGGNKGKILPLSSSMTTSLSSQSKVLTSSQSIEKACDSECDSETEEMEILNDEDKEENVAKSNDKDDAAESFLPFETIDRKENVEIWKSRNESDVIVSDHDVFGTHENEEDSLDSLALREDTLESVYEEGDDSTMSTDFSQSHSSSFHHETDQQHLDYQDGSLRPKRKSGSLSELTLPGSLPLKKQRPESLFCQGQQKQILLLETPDSVTAQTRDNLDSLTQVNCDTAPTSPRSPTPGPIGGSGSSLLGAVIRSHGRSLIPDKENPPQDILDWVSTFTRWSHAERLLAIDQLIDSCEPQQVRHMMQVIEPQFQRDFISLLPKELALYTLSFLEPRDLLRAAQTCRYWRILAEDNLLWREKCKEAGLGDSREFFRKRTKLASGFIYSPWKSSFMRQHNIEMNWRIQPIRTAKILKGHDDHVITCLQFSGNRIVSGSDDNTLKVWSATTGKCLRTLVGHTGGVWSSQMANNVIVSGSTDRTLKVWNVESGTCVHTLYGHTSTVRCMHLHQTRVVSGSRDATLRMWDVESGECLHVLVGHVAAVRCVQYDGRLVVSGAYDYMVKVWNPDREECLHTLSGHTNRVYSLQFDGIHVVSGSLDTSIRVWDVETGTCKHALMGHQSLTSGMELQDNILVSGNADSTVKIWDILTGQCLQTLSGPNKHQSAVTCLQFNKKFVITSSDDGTVKLWDVKSGDFIRDLVALDSGGSGGVVWRIRSSQTKLVCAVGSRNGTEETKLMVLDFDAEVK